MAYSAVTQPLPLPDIHRGTPFVNDAVQSTRVSPNEMSAEPSAWRLHPRSMVIGRNWSVVRPSARMISFTGSDYLPVGVRGDRAEVEGAGAHQVDAGDLRAP